MCLMSVTGVTPGSRDMVFTQVAKIVSSDIIRGSDSLCRLLRYLAEQAVDHPGSSVKEYQIATEVFGRPADFDPRLDSTVRVQTGRLRSKISEYYAGVGAEDPVVVEIPKGTYSLAVHLRVPHAPPLPPPATAVSPPVAKPDARFRPTSNVAVWALVCLCAGLVIAVIYLAGNRPAPAAVLPPDAPASLRSFWQGFTDSPDQPCVVFSNAEFVGRPEKGMRYFDPARDDRSAILDHYTGVGEVLAIHELDSLFGTLKHGIRVKRGRLLSMDDVKNNDIIFVGSPSENLTLREIPTTRDFVFRTWDRGPRKGDLAIVNLHPRQGEDVAYFGSPGIPISEDYALIGMVPGMTASRWVMILAGTTTIGTQAAVEYVCRLANVNELLGRVGRSSTGEILPFEAVIRVKVSRGVPVNSELMAVHTVGL